MAESGHLLATLDFEYITRLFRQDPLNPSVRLVLSNVLQELVSSRISAEQSEYERLRKWLTDPRPVYQNEDYTILSLGIDSSPPLFVAKMPTHEEFEHGRQLNELLDLEICPGVLYTYILLKNVSKPVLRNDDYVWMHESDQQLMLLEYIPGVTLDDVLDLPPWEFASTVLQIILTLWIINHRFKRVHGDLHHGNVILRPLCERQWISYQTPIGPRWIRSSNIATVIDYADLELEDQPGGGEAVELLSRLHENVSTEQSMGNSTVNAFLLRKILDPLGIHITWSKTRKAWNQRIDEVPVTYQQILDSALTVFGKNLDLSTVWSGQPQPMEPHLSYDKIITHRRSVTDIKQLCELGLKFSSRPMIEISQIINNVGLQLNNLMASCDRERAVVGQVEPLLYNRNKEFSEYLRAMVVWADDIHRGYSLLRCLNYAVDMIEFEQSIDDIIAIVERTRRLYLLHLPIFREIAALYQGVFMDTDEEHLFDRYETTSLKPYHAISESIAVYKNFTL